MVVRATVVCVHKGTLLLVKQTFADMGRFWSLPGGKVEAGETLAEAAIRETKEETGITVALGRVLYISQRFVGKKHIVQVLFEGTFKSGHAGQDLALTPHENVESIRFVPLSELESVGISKVFADRVRQNFPDAGSYIAAMSDIGL